MEGFLWLLLQILPLLTAVATVFFILGWHWHGQNTKRKKQGQNPEVDSEDFTVQTARYERDTAHTTEEKVRLILAQTQAELQESQDRQTLLQKEILRLSDELKQAKQSLESERQALHNEHQAHESAKLSLASVHEAMLKLQLEQETVRPPATQPAKKPRSAKTPKDTSSSKSKKSRSSKSGENEP